MRRTDKVKLTLLLLVLGGAAAYLAITGLSAVFRDPKVFHTHVQELGVWGPAFIIGIQAVQVLLPPIPGQVIGMTAGYLYGPLWGVLLCTAGLALGSWLSVWLARRLGRPLVERFASAELIERLDRLSRRHGLWVFFLVFLLPFLPTDVGCFVAGLTTLPIGSIVVLAIIGRLPGVLLLNWLGATSQVLGPEALAGVVALGLVGGLLMVRHRARLQDAMFALMRRLGVY